MFNDRRPDWRADGNTAIQDNTAKPRYNRPAAVRDAENALRERRRAIEARREIEAHTQWL